MREESAKRGHDALFAGSRGTGACSMSPSSSRTLAASSLCKSASALWKTAMLLLAIASLPAQSLPRPASRLALRYEGVRGWALELALPARYVRALELRARCETVRTAQASCHPSSPSLGNSPYVKQLRPLSFLFSFRRRLGGQDGRLGSCLREPCWFSCSLAPASHALLARSTVVTTVKFPLAHPSRRPCT